MVHLVGKKINLSKSRITLLPRITLFNMACLGLFFCHDCMRAYGAASSSSQTPAVANNLNALEIPHEDECVTLGCIGNMLGLLAGRSNNEMLGFCWW